jgi:hypothetical protein
MVDGELLMIKTRQNIRESCRGLSGWWLASNTWEGVVSISPSGDREKDRIWCPERGSSFVV